MAWWVAGSGSASPPYHVYESATDSQGWDPAGHSFPTRAAAEAWIAAHPASGSGGGGGGGGGGAPPGTAPQSGFSGASHGPTVAQWLTTPLCRNVAIPQPGDLAIWGPNAHMGIVTSATEMISALDPALGTRVTSIAGAHGGVPVYRRLLATEQAGIPAAGGGGQAQNTARLLLPRYGWGASEFAPLVKLWGGESGWNPRARNPGSGALGVAQALGHGGPGTAGSLGNDYGAQYGLTQAEAQAANSGNAMQQIRWGLGYIKAVYGSPSSAYAAWQGRTPHWYAGGGVIPPGKTGIVGEEGKPEYVTASPEGAVVTPGAPQPRRKPGRPR
jgi:hypothetical protein